MSTKNRIQPTGSECNESGRAADEGTPLLHVPLSELDLTIANNETTDSYIDIAKGELKWLASSSSLTILTLFLQFSFNTANILVVGRLGAKELGAMTLAVTCQVVLALAPTFGLLSAMDTFCSTAYTASRDKTLVGFHFQRGIIAVCTHFILVAPIMWNFESIMLLLRQDPEIARLSGLYMRIHILSTLSFSLYEATRRYLQAQGIMRAATIIVLVVAPLHWINCYIFVWSPRFGMGFVGAPIVNAVSNNLLLIGILIFTRNCRARKTWGGWKLSAFSNMWDYYRLAIPAIIPICADWASFELLSLGASYFGTYQLAANAVMFNTLVFQYQFSNGIGNSIAPRVGNLIGDAKPRQARIAAKVSLLVSALFGIMSSLFLSLCGDWWISLYTDDPNVARETARLTPILCIFIMSDGMNGVLAAILRGIGRQTISANIYILGFYVCGVPTAIYLGYKQHFETPGLWMGACIGVIITCTLQVVYVFFLVDWKDEVRLCLLRLKGSTSEHFENYHLE